MNYEAGDVVLLEFTFSDGKGKKKRPGLIISSGNYNQKRQEVIVAAITSNVKRILPGDTPIKKWKAAGLIAPSLVAGIVQTVKKTIIEKKLGKLEKGDFAKVGENFKGIFGFFCDT